MTTREQFYKSKKWLTFRSVIINDRTDEDGFVHCCACGKPILHKYDLIIHHKVELTEANVNNAMVALNPDNVECICFRCHNKVHDRFGDKRSTWQHALKKHVYIVYGSPASGKTTWVYENATPDDLIIDLDKIWQMISINDKYVKPGSLKQVVFAMRDKLYDIVRYRSGKWHTAFIITGGALIGDRQRLMQRVGADECVYIDTSYEECMRRVHNKGLPDDLVNEWIGYINEWWDKYQPDEIV
jgi:hypothetical protein